MGNDKTTHHLYRARLALESATKSLHNAGSFDLVCVCALTLRVDQVANKMLSDSTELHLLCSRSNVSDCVGLVVRDAIEGSHSIDHLYDSMGIGDDIKVLRPREASGIVGTVEKRTNRAHPSERDITPEFREWVAKLSKRPVRILEKCRTHDDLIDRLCQGGPNEFLCGVATLLGKELTEYQQGLYYGPYMGHFRDITNKNESGALARMADRSKSTCRSTGDWRQYCMGRLPEGHVRQLAIRETTREFLRAAWGCVFVEAAP